MMDGDGGVCLKPHVATTTKNLVLTRSLVSTPVFASAEGSVAVLALVLLLGR